MKLIKNIKIGLPAVFFFLLTFAGVSYGQYSWSIQDSLNFDKVKNDIASLRSLADKWKGSKMGAAAQSRIGVLLFLDKKLVDAKKEIDDVIMNYSGFEEANEGWFILGRIDYVNGKWADAKEKIDKYIKNAKGKTWFEGAEYYSLIASYKLKEGGIQERFRNYLKQKPLSYFANHVQYHLFKSYVEQKDWANAITEGLNLCAKYPLTEYAKDIQYQVGEYYYRLGQIDKAIAHYQSIADKNLPNTEPAAIADYKKGEVYQKTKNYTKARLEFDKVKTKHSLVANWFILSRYSDAMTYYDEAMDYREKNDTLKNKTASDKLNAFVKSYATDKRTPRAYMNIANIEKQAGNYDNALKAYNSIIAFNPEKMTNIAEGFKEKEMKEHSLLVTDARLAKASLLKQMGASGDEISREYGSILLQDPKNEDALLGSGMCLLQEGKKEAATAVFTKVVEMNGVNKQMAQDLINTVKGGK